MAKWHNKRTRLCSQRGNDSPRDTTKGNKEISETAREMRDRGVIRDTASAIDRDNNRGPETAETVKDTD